MGMPLSAGRRYICPSDFNYKIFALNFKHQILGDPELRLYFINFKIGNIFRMCPFPNKKQLNNQGEKWAFKRRFSVPYPMLNVGKE